MSFLTSLGVRVAATSPRIGFPEAKEKRVRAAIRRLAAGPVTPVIVGARTDAAGGDLPPLEWLDPADPELREQALATCADLAPAGGGDTLRFAVAMLAAGRLDGVVAGASLPTAEVVRAGLRVLGTASGIDTVSSSFYMILSTPEREERVLTFTDAAVIPRPSSGQLVEIAIEACRARRLVVGDEPRVAFLSYSTRGSAGGESVTRVRDASARFRERCPEIRSDGELQADAALVPEVAARKAPESACEGRANVLVFPDLDAGNIAYKLVQRLANGVALGPILQGLAAPLNDLSRGASEEEIVHVAYITGLMAQRTARE